MDEVDIDREDFNELEARLYGQIHHEAVDSTVVNKAVETQTKSQVPENQRVERIVTERSVVNRPAKTSRVPDTRYWANSVKITKQFNAPAQAEQITTSVISEVNQNKKLEDNENSTKNIALEAKASSNRSPANDAKNASENKWQSQSPNNDAVQPQEQQEPQEIQQTNIDNTPHAHLRINPAAVVKNTKTNLKKKKQKLDEHVLRSGPFQQQEIKLQKALLVQAKKKKSKNVRKKKRKQQPQIETILVDSSSDSTSATSRSDDDVVLIPEKPPPTITVSDSDNEGIDVESSVIQLEEENSMDASDVVMDNKTFSNKFTKPTEVRSSDDPEKQAEQVPSSCASPCSVLSSDDFIGQTDQSRLLEDNCMADDQDLVLLTADVDSLMQPPPNQANNAKQSNAATIKSATEDVVCTGQFIAPLLKSTAVTEANKSLEKQNKQQTNYHVDQTEFRAMDVYESESDITDNVYSKGTGRIRTIINAIDSSSEADDVQQMPTNQKVKRLSKRRTSSSNRGSDANYEDASTDDELDDGATKTPISFILRGTAVERCNKKIRKRAQSLGSRRASGSGVASAAGNMSDTEFIATLNSLVHGRDDDVNKKTEEKPDEDDNWEDDMQFDSNQDKNIVENQAEQQQSTNLTLKFKPDQVSVRSVQLIEPLPVSASFSEAVPDLAMAGLDKIFASIDNMVEPTLKKKPRQLEDSSDDEIEAIHPPVPTSSEAERREINNVLPIGHIVYNELNMQLGGVGWNEEMMKFYNFSWHGERFNVVGVQKGMERDRNLWKIYTEDRFPKTRPYSNLKCYNCCEFGHTRAKCRRPKKPPICYMCGESGHFEPRCPNTICLRCGNKTQVFTKSCNACTFQNRLICPICKVRGHSINLCPDKWRRYHSTTQPNVHPNSQIEFNKRRMCCICGGNGHLSDTCRSAVRFMEYPIIVSHVKSHQKSYSDLLFKSQHIGLALNLLYRPGDAVAFRMAEKTTPDGYYWRFLKSVGLGSLLRRKRPGDCFTAPEKRSKHARNLSAKYEPNPYGRAAREVGQTTDTADDRNIAEAAPNQVQEVSGSMSTAEAVSSGAQYPDLTEDISVDEFEHMEYTNEANETVAENTPEVDVVKNAGNGGNEFKAPGEASTNTHQSMQHKENLTADSDSNYSFSDHFEIQPAGSSVNKEMLVEESALDVQPSTSAAARGMLAVKLVRELEPMPDFIPLTDKSDGSTSDVADNSDTQIGISRRFAAVDTDDEIEEDEAQQRDLPCEAKIYLTQFHSNFLLSPDGHEFLEQKSKECHIKARLDWTSVGHVLIIFGFPRHQDTFHKTLLGKFHELMDQINNKQLTSIKVPKRIDALIRFLRENISQLQSDLGDVNELQRRIKNLDQTHTKANMKLAEKFRRLLNMILLGQAGLCDGDKHLDKLLVNLKSLINDYQAENMVPQSLREEIDSHSKMIFTSYRHDNYPDLIQLYNSLPKSRQLILDIDPLLLGQKMLNVCLTAEQRARLEQPPNTPTPIPQFNQTTPAKKSADIESNSLNVNKSKMINKQKDSNQPSQSQASIRYEPTCSSKVSNRPDKSPVVSTSSKDKSNTSTSIKRQTVASPPFVNPQQKSTVITKFKEAVQTRHSVLEDLIDNDITPSPSRTDINATKRAPSKGPSVFWSRESMRYLDECLQLAESNAELLLKLQRIQLKSAEGALSYNDYRAVIKLHGAMVGH